MFSSQQANFIHLLCKKKHLADRPGGTGTGMPDEVTGLDRIGMPVDVDEEEGTIGTYSLFSASDHMNEISILSYFL